MLEEIDRSEERFFSSILPSVQTTRDVRPTHGHVKWEELPTVASSVWGEVDEITTTIIIPAYNEEAALPLVLKPLFSVIDETYEVVVVDDGSSDNSIVAAAEFPCRIIRHTRNAGKGAAMRTGILNARGAKVVFIDADNTYPVEMIPSMVDLLDECDIVRGIRLSGRNNIPVLNRVGNRLFDTIIRVFHAVEGGDLLSGMYGGYRDRFLELDLESDDFAIEAEINVKAQTRGLKCETIPITYVERVGEKKLRPFHDGLSILYRVLQLAFTHNPLLMFVLPGHFLAALGASGLAWILLDSFRNANAAAGVNGLLVLSVMLIVGIQLIIFGIAVYEAGMVYGLRGRAHPFLERMSHTLRGRVFMVAALILSTVGTVGLTWTTMEWLTPLQAPIRNPVMLLLMTLCLMFGFQILSSSAFLSALRGLQVNMAKRARK